MLIGVHGRTESGKDEVAKICVNDYNFIQKSFAYPVKDFCKNVFDLDYIQLWGPGSAKNSFDPRYNRCEIKSSGIVFKPTVASLRSVKRVCDPAWGKAAERLLEYAPGWLKDIMPAATDHQALLNSLCEWFASLGHKYSEFSPRIVIQYLGTEWGRDLNPDIWVDYLFRNISLQDDIVISDVRFENEIKAIKYRNGKLLKINRYKTDTEAFKVGITHHRSENNYIDENYFDVIVNNNASINTLKENVSFVISTIKQAEEKK